MHVTPLPNTPNPSQRAQWQSRANRYLTIRDELDVFYTDQDFATFFPTRGQPAESPWRLALILVFQFAEELSDK